MQRMICFVALVLMLSGPSWTRAEVKLPNIFGSHMVLQQGQKNKVWGLANAGESVTVTIDKQSHQATAGADGKWQLMLDSLAVGGPYGMSVRGKNEILFEDILVGEVWRIQRRPCLPVPRIVSADD